MRKNVCLLFLLLVGLTELHAQVLEEINTGGNPPKSYLSAGEIVVLNGLDKDITIRCSYNKATWVQKSLEGHKGYSLILPIQKSHLYVEVCYTPGNSSSGDCDIYKIPPKKRYVITYSDNQNKLELRKAQSDN